jgi:SAM-dependent methyltransferase
MVHESVEPEFHSEQIDYPENRSFTGGGERGLSFDRSIQLISTADFNMDCEHPDFWNERFASGKMPWDIHGVPAEVHSFIKRSTPGSVLIPGCGSGYEIGAFLETGWDVTAIDFASGAVELARKNFKRPGVEIMLGDFFAVDFGERRFDAIYERRFLCAIPPSRWRECMQRMAELLKPGGMLAGIFLYGENDPEGPPFPMTEGQAEEILGSHFSCVRDEAMGDSEVGGADRWQEWARK